MDFSTRRAVATAAIAGALTVSACTAPAAPPAGSTSAASSTEAASLGPASPGPGPASDPASVPASEAPSAPASEAGSAPASEAGSAPAAEPAPGAAGPEPVPYHPPQGGFDVGDPAAIQSVLAQNFITELVTNQYSLSGQWVADGASHAGTAKLWENRLSDNLKAKLTAAGRGGDVSGFGSWAVIALPGPDSTEAVKASPTCAAASEPHCLLIQETAGEAGTMTQAGGPRLATLDQSVPNRVAFTYDVAIPVSLTGNGNAEGVMKGVLKVDLTYVANPNPAAGGPEFLIDSIRNDLTGTTTDVLASTPGLMFESY